MCFYFYFLFFKKKPARRCYAHVFFLHFGADVSAQGIFHIINLPFRSIFFYWGGHLWRAHKSGKRRLVDVETYGPIFFLKKNTDLFFKKNITEKKKR